jgi:hypothetical protein
VSRCLHGYADDRPCDRCAPTRAERRVEVAAEALWRAAHYRTRNEAGDAARAVVAALDAHDGDLRERLAGAVEARARDHAYVVGETADAPATNNPTQRGRDEGIQIAYAEVVRLIRNRP